MKESKLSKTILLVEDEIIIALGEAAMLKKHGFKVILANNADDAIKKAADESVDLIFMDIDLGSNRMNGTNAAQIILKENEIPIIFLTSHAEKEVVEKVKGITRYGYVLKSSGEFVLLEAINMAFELFNAHSRLKESEEKYKAAFLTSPDAVNINSLNGLYVEINEGFTKLTGFTREDVIGKLSSEIKIWAIPEDRERLIRGLQKDGYVENLESVFRRKDGSLTTALMSARILTINGGPHILSITRDISIRKVIENKLKISEQMYRSILQANPDGYWLADGSGRILEVNHSYCTMSGYSEDELLTMKISDLDALESINDTKERIANIMQSGGMCFESKHRAKDGAVFPVSISVSKLSTGDMGKFVAFIRDGRD